MELPVNYNNCSTQTRKLVREEYVRIQNGLCHYCKQPLSGEPSDEVLSLSVNKNLFPEHFFKNPIHLHHNHFSGLTIGAVHSYCNAVLWEYEFE